jgi:hypothetical protein
VSRASRRARARSALAWGIAVAVASLGALWPLEPEAHAQTGATGAGGAPGSAEKASNGNGQAGAEKSGAGGGAAEATPPPPGVGTKVVVFVEGPKAAEVRAEIEKALPPGVLVLPDGPYVEALKKQAILPLARTIRGPKERQKIAPKLQIIARDVGAQAAVLAIANPVIGGKYDVPILIVPSDSPEPLSSTNAVGTGKAGTQTRADALAGIVSASISGIIPPAPPPEPESKPEEVVIEEKKVEPPAEPKPPPPPPVTNPFLRGKFLFEAGAGTQGRSFFYIFPPDFERDSTLVRGYRLLFAPHAFVRADVYPFAGPEESFANNIGLTAHGGGSVTIKSTLGGGEREEPEEGVATTFIHFRVGPKLRFPLGPGDGATLLTAELTYSYWNYTFADATGSAPSYIYQSVRPAAGLRQPLGPLVLLFDAGLHYVVNSGELTRRFPQASVLGFDAELGLGLPIGKYVEPRIKFNYNRYRGNLKADVQSPTGYVAAGSVDQFFGAHLGAAVAF